MKYGLTNLKDFKNFNYQKATSFVQQNWMKLIIIIVVLFIILKKDISLNFNLQAAGSSASPIQEIYEMPEEEIQIQPVKLKVEKPKKEIIKPKAKKEKKKQELSVAPLPYFEPEHRLKSTFKDKPKIKEDNRANHFANLTFILNPNYLKRKKIDRELVIEKQNKVYGYVNKYASIAVEEMKKYGVPASITLAQGLLESDAGESRLALKNKNHFGIKCFSKKCKKGHCANFTDDSHKDFFRKYKSVWESYRAHSIFLQRKRYAHLKSLGNKNYRAWAIGLRKAGYATDPKYAEKLIKIIEVLELEQFDG